MEGFYEGFLREKREETESLVRKSEMFVISGVRYMGFYEGFLREKREETESLVRKSEMFVISGVRYMGFYEGFLREKREETESLVRKSEMFVISSGHCSNLFLSLYFMTDTHIYIYTLQGLRYPREALQSLLISLEPFGQYNS